MQDDELYQRIAGSIAPWTISEFNVDPAGQQVDVLVECHDTVPKQCPHCDCMLLACDLGDEQTWRQPDAGSWQILLRGRLPLIECPEHGMVRVSPPWADWYVRGLDKSLLGPWSLQQLKLLMDAGRITPSTLLKRSTSGRWVIAGTVAALFVRQDEAVEPPLSVYELAAVDWAIANEPVVFESIEPASEEDFVSGHIPADDSVPDEFVRGQTPTRGSGPRRAGRDANTTGGHPPWRPAAGRSPRRDYEGDQGHDSRNWPRLNCDTSEPDVTGGTPVGKDSISGFPDDGRELRLLEDADKDPADESPPIIKPPRPSAPREPEVRPDSREKRRSSRRPKPPLEPSPSEWGMAIEQAVEMELSANVIRKTPEDDPVGEPLKRLPRHEALARRRGFQTGYQLLMLVSMVNACLVCCMIPAVCMIFFARLLLLSTSVFAPFEGGNDLQEGQLVECGLSALCLLVLIGFPVWHLKSNDAPMLHYIPSALVGMAIGFGLSPAYLDKVCAALQWCEFLFGIASVGLLIYLLSTVPARSRMSLPMVGAGLVTALSTLALLFVRTGSMLSVQADAIPPQLRGAVPDAPLYVLGLYGTLACIPAALLFELYRHTDYDTRQLIVRTGVIAGVYLVAGFATLDAFVHGAGTGFFDVPLALLPLGCVNALAAAIPAVLFLANPQYTLTED